MLVDKSIIASILGGIATVIAAIITLFKKDNKSKKIKINQHSKGDNNTIIAMQNNGLSIQDACQIAKTLFEENFPKLQEEAMKVAVARIDELWEKIKSKISLYNIQDYTAFSTPDMQYILCESQKEYARYGTKDKLEVLAELIFKRINYDNDEYIKIVIDKALLIINQLSEYQLNYLSAMFICKQVKFSNIHNEQDLIKNIKIFADKLFFPHNISVSWLNSLGCFELHLGSADKIISQAYGLDIETVKKMLPDNFLHIHADYGVSHVGVILAITNIQAKVGYSFNPKTWVAP